MSIQVRVINRAHDKYLVVFDNFHTIFDRYSIYDLDNDGMYLVDLNISLCFEAAGPCALEVEVFKQTVLTKRTCPKYTGFLKSSKQQHASNFL